MPKPNENPDIKDKNKNIELEKKKIVVDFEVKSIEDQDKFFVFAGYASTFGNIDRCDDIIEKGSFKACLEKLKAKDSKLALLWQHDTDMPIGIFETLIEDSKGLFVEAKMPKNDTFVAGRVIPQMEVGSVRKMSIGFSIKQWEIKDIDGDRIRCIKKVNLWEISLVTIPANDKADVTEMKKVTPFRNFPIASKESQWDSLQATRRVREFTNSTEKPSSSYKKAFLWYDENNADTFGAYKLPFVDVIDGDLKIVPRAIFAVAAVLQGARGGVNVPSEDKEKLKAMVSKYYKKMDLVAPWEEEEDDKGFNIDEINSMKDANEYLRNKGLSRNETEAIMARIRHIHDQSKSVNSESEIDLDVICKSNLEALELILKNIKGEDKCQN
jgi:HK97 family phage prohead protease